jgi:hypothetical protein
MKTYILLISFFLSAVLKSNAQEKKDAMDTYFGCMAKCRDGQGGGSAGDIAQCKQVCYDQTKCPKVGRVVLTKVPTLATVIGSKQVKSGSVLIHTDKIYQYFAAFENGKLIGYQIKNTKGVALPFPLVAFTIDNNKPYCLFGGAG